MPSKIPLLGVFSKCICHRHCLCVCLSHCFLLARSSLWSNVSKVKSLKDRSLKVFSKCICHCLCFWWSGHVFSSLWKNVSKFKSLKDRSLSLKVFSKCICHCLCCCLFVGQVMFPHHSDQMSPRSKVSTIALWRCSLLLMYFSLSLILYLSLLSFYWPGYVFSWSPSVLRGLVWNHRQIVIWIWQTQPIYK